jgi:8-oxo-dGTP diphosphatase
MATVDAVVFSWDYDGNLMVAMIRRKDNGKLALPGGYVNYDESLMHAATRELKEETGLVLGLENYKGRLVFDDPKRSSVGNRKITTAHIFKLSGVEGDLPTLTAGDDAAEASWIGYRHLDDTPIHEFHDDHRVIIEFSIQLI